MIGRNREPSAEPFTKVGELDLGPSGLGKSHVCVSIGPRAVAAGYTVL